RELRIGNLFYPIERKDGIDIPQEVPFVVSGIMFFQVTGFQLGESVSQTAHHDFGFKSISPIPITEELLLKGGFKYEDLGDDSPYEWYRIDNFELWNFNGEYWLCDMLDQYGIDLDLRDLHEIQNLFYSL